jgi:hypothetical protein
MTMVTRRRRHRAMASRVADVPVLDTDLHAYVIARLDAHLAALHAIRDELVRPRSTRPGARWYASVASLVEAAQYGRDVGRALGTCNEPEPVVEVPPGGQL